MVSNLENVYSVSLGLGIKSETSKMPEVIAHMLMTKNPLIYCIECNGRVSEYYGPIFNIYGTKENVLCWLDLFRDEYPQINSDVDKVISKINSSDLVVHPELGYSILLEQIK